MKQIAVYTVIFGKFDKPQPINPDFLKEADFYLFTDREIRESDYIIKKVEPVNENLRRASRLYKLNSHYFFPNYKYTIYLDGSIEMLISPRKAIKTFLNGADIAVLKHPWRDCIYTEIRECIKLGYAGRHNGLKLIDYLKLQNYPEHNGLTENGVMIRRNTEEVEVFNKLWYSVYQKFTQRDQHSFCYCMWVLGMKYNMIETGIRPTTNLKPDLFILKEHNR